MKFFYLFALLWIPLVTFAKDGWQLLCVPNSETGCHSLWKTETLNNGKSTLIFSYNISGTKKHPIPSIVIDLDNLPLADQTTAIGMTVGKAQFSIPVVATDDSGVMATLGKNNAYTVSQVISALEQQPNVILTVPLKGQQQPLSVTISLKEFHEKLPRMLHGDALFVGQP